MPAGNCVNGRHIGVAVMSRPANVSSIAGTRVIASAGGIQPERIPARMASMPSSRDAGSASRRFT